MWALLLACGVILTCSTDSIAKSLKKAHRSTSHGTGSHTQLLYQSPINLASVLTIWESPLRKLGFYRKYATVTVKNTGHTVQLSYNKPGQKSKMMITGGPLGAEKYYFQQMHWHWGKNMKEGDEHQEGGHKFPLEGHMVFQSKDGDFAVLGVLYEASPKENKAMSSVTNAVKKLIEPGSSQKMKIPFPLRAYLPREVHTYYHYVGSLTTPPYTEGVNWIVFLHRSPVTPEQVEPFRHIKDPEGHEITRNFRPIQPQNNRTVGLVIERVNGDDDDEDNTEEPENITETPPKITEKTPTIMGAYLKSVHQEKRTYIEQKNLHVMA